MTGSFWYPRVRLQYGFDRYKDLEKGVLEFMKNRSDSVSLPFSWKKSFLKMMWKNLIFSL